MLALSPVITAAPLQRLRDALKGRRVALQLLELKLIQFDHAAARWTSGTQSARTHEIDHDGEDYDERRPQAAMRSATVCGICLSPMRGVAALDGRPHKLLSVDGSTAFKSRGRLISNGV
jgi:hypothetical protein